MEIQEDITIADDFQAKLDEQLHLLSNLTQNRNDLYAGIVSLVYDPDPHLNELVEELCSTINTARIAQQQKVQQAAPTAETESTAATPSVKFVIKNIDYLPRIESRIQKLEGQINEQYHAKSTEMSNQKAGFYLWTLSEMKSGLSDLELKNGQKNGYKLRINEQLDAVKKIACDLDLNPDWVEQYCSTNEYMNADYNGLKDFSFLDTQRITACEAKLKNYSRLHDQSLLDGLVPDAPKAETTAAAAPAQPKSAETKKYGPLNFNRTPTQTLDAIIDEIDKRLSKIDEGSLTLNYLNNQDNLKKVIKWVGEITERDSKSIYQIIKGIIGRLQERKYERAYAKEDNNERAN